MNILYGVVGDGLGHALRSSVIIRQLIQDGHDVHIVASFDGLTYLKQRFPNVSQIWGLTIATKDNRINPYLTAYHLFRGAISGVPHNTLKMVELTRQFDADLVITDFDAWAYVYGKLHGIPVIGLDNVHLLTHVEHPDEIVQVDDYFEKYKLAQLIAENRVPDADHYLVSSFAPSSVKDASTTTLIPPVLRQAILDAEPVEGDHLLVYQTSYSTFETSKLLEELDIPIRAYGLDRELTEDRVEGHITYRPFSETEFIRDLASAKALFATSGFTLMTEAMYLGKPYFALPVQGQIEQMLNARYLRELGYGDFSETPTREDLEAFLAKVPEYRDNLKSYTRSDNSPTFALLNDLMEKLVPDHPSRPRLMGADASTSAETAWLRGDSDAEGQRPMISIALEDTPASTPRDVAILDATHHGEAVRPSTVVAGLEIVRRQVRLAHVSGCEEAILVTTKEHEQAVRAVLDKVWFDIKLSVRIARSSRLDEVMLTVAQDLAERLGDEQRALYLKTTNAYYRHLPNQLRAQLDETGGAWFYQDPDGVHAPDLFVLDRAGFREILEIRRDYATPMELLARLEERDASEIHSYYGDATSWSRHLATQHDADAATEQIWLDCRKRTDGPVSRHFNRYISLFISRRIAGTGIKANQVTLVTATLGVLGGLLGLLGGYWGFLAAALAYKTNSIIDGVDGEMARGKYEFSEWGAWLDNFSDDSKDILFYIGVAVGAYTSGYPFFEGFGPEAWLWVLGITLFGKALSLSGYYSFLLQNGIGDLRHFQFWFEEKDESPRAGIASWTMAKLKILTKNDVMVLGALLFAVAGVLPWFIFIAAIGQTIAGVNIIAARIWQSRRQPEAFMLAE